MANDTALRVLDVGQCDPDHANITRTLKAHFDVTVDRAKSAEQVLYMMGFYDYDLVLVNRIFDADGSEGLDLIRQLKQDKDRAKAPIMLVSNYADAQESAAALGALTGFGKAELDATDTIGKLKAVLSPDTP
jgi:CheY-like chemotaxis protein